MTHIFLIQKFKIGHWNRYGMFSVKQQMTRMMTQIIQEICSIFVYTISTGLTFEVVEVSSALTVFINRNLIDIISFRNQNRHGFTIAPFNCLEPLRSSTQCFPRSFGIKFPAVFLERFGKSSS